MVDVTTPPSGGGDRIEPVDIQVEMQRSYLDYAMTVIVGRALPDVRDGLKPVHRKILYGMFDGGFRPDRGYVKCARVVGDVMGNYHPHGDSAIYDALVRMAQPWSMRYPLVDGNGNFGSPGNDPAAAMRYTECTADPAGDGDAAGHRRGHRRLLADYDGRTTEPDVLPSRIPNLLVNGVRASRSAWPPTSRRTTCARSPTASVGARPPGGRRRGDPRRADGADQGSGLPDRGADRRPRRHRGRVPDRPRLDPDARGGRRSRRTPAGARPWWSPSCPTRSTRTTWPSRSPTLVRDGRLAGIGDIADESSDRVGRRLVITLHRDAVAKVVLNNLYKHTQLQTTFGANMLALVDGVPRTLRLDQFVRYYVAHQIEVIVRRTRYRLRKAEERAHILRALLKALDQLDEVIALIRASESADAARGGLMELLDIDEVQATAILDMQLRRLAALERQRMQDEYARLEAEIADFNAILASEARQREIVREELAEIAEKYGDDRRTRLVSYDGDVSMEDLIADEDVVVTITRTGYAKRTKTDLYRSQRRGGKGVQGAQLKQDDIVAHFFVCSTHDWILFFTNKGRVYRAKAYELPEANRAARGQHVANLLAFQPDEQIAQVIQLRDYEVAPYLVLATRRGLVKKTRLTDFDSNRAGGIVAINLREDDELIGAALIEPTDDLLLVSRKAQSIRFHADDESLRPMGRATSGVIGMRFGGDDELLAMEVAREGTELLVATEGGYAKRTQLEEYPVQGRGGRVC